MEITKDFLMEHFEKNIDAIMKDVFTGYRSPIKDAIEGLFKSEEVKLIVETEVRNAIKKVVNDKDFTGQMKETILLEAIKSMTARR